MPRKIDDTETFQDLHDEIDYTLARAEDEPLAAELTATIATWSPRVDAAQRLARELAREEVRCDAARQGANLALDGAVEAFGEDLARETDKDKTHPRWRGHFRTLNLSGFNRQAFATQVPDVRGWLTASADPLLATHRPSLEATTARAEAALARTNALAARRASLWQARRELAEFLTDARDALHDDLSRLARASRLGRSWADSFFRSSGSHKKAKPEDTEGGGGATPSTTPTA